MGVVCKYRNATLNKFAAVKLITAKDLPEIAMMRFQREGQAAARLQHPGIVGVHDLGVTEFGDPYMIMDYFEGETVEELLQRKYQFSLPQLETIFQQSAEAMDHAHSQGVLHRDLKPSNIMVTNLKSDQLVIKILDFGIAKLLDEDGEFTTTAGLNVGSPMYMSPEQSQGSTVDARADIYSLGCVFYAVLVGEPPFKGKNALELSLQHLKEKPLPISQIPHLRHLSYIGDTIMAMLEKDPLRRPQSMREVCRLLRRGGTAIKRKKARAWRSSVLAISVGSFVIAGFAAAKVFTPRADAPAVVQTVPVLTPPALPNEQKLKIQQAAFDKQLAQAAKLGAAHINFGGRPLTDKGLACLPSDHNLVDLVLPATGITDAGLKSLGAIPSLTRLDVSMNARITSAGMKHLTGLTNLQSLQLGQTGLNDEGCKYIRDLANLEDLDVQDTAVTDEGMRHLINLKKIKKLTLGNTGVTDATMRLLPNWPQLETLKLQHSSISDKGMAHIKNIIGLRDLSLTQTAVTPQGILLVSHLRNLRKFETPTTFNDSCAQIFSQLPNLEVVRLSGKITGKTIDAMMNLQHMHKLNLRGGLASRDPAVKRFQAAHPKCDIDTEVDLGQTLQEKADQLLGN